MDTVFRSVAVYLFLLVVFRISGKRSLSQITTFDFILLLIISEATQNALVGDDFSITTSMIVVGVPCAARVVFQRSGEPVEDVPPRSRKPAGGGGRKRAVTGKSRETRGCLGVRYPCRRPRASRPGTARAVQYTRSSSGTAASAWCRSKARASRAASTPAR